MDYGISKLINILILHIHGKIVIKVRYNIKLV